METFTLIDSFSQLHSYSYSIIALQELNLNFYYPRVYWNCACLSVEASGVKEDGTTSTSTDYGEVAKAIYKMHKSDIRVSAPSINNSEMEFTPIEETSSILFGIAGIAGINAQITEQIINNRPYSSFKDFYEKNTFEGTLITKSKMIQLIKAGCFDEFEPDRIKVMKQYVVLSAPKKEKVTTANLPEILRMKIQIPSTLISPYKFKKYVCQKKFFYDNHPNFKSKKLYWLDAKAEKYFRAKMQSSLEENKDYFFEEDMIILVDKSIDSLFKEAFNNLKEYINTPEFLKRYNNALLKDTYNTLVPNKNVNHWSFEACSFYSHNNEFVDVDCYAYSITPYDEIPEEPVFVEKSRGNRTWRQYELYRIAGVVLDRNDNRHTLTILDVNDNVVNCKMNGEFYAFYRQQISIEDGDKTKVVDPSWFKRGQALIITGYRNGESDFRVKTYKNSIYQHQVQKITNITENGELEIQSYRYGYEPEVAE